MKIGSGVSELWGVEYRPLPLTWPMTYTTTCTTVQAVVNTALNNINVKKLQFIHMLTATDVRISKTLGQVVLTHCLAPLKLRPYGAI